MKHLISIYIWIIGIFGYFILFSLVILTSWFLPKEKSATIIRLGSRLILFLSFFRIDISYETEFDYSKDYIFMGNHVSLLDAIVMAAYLPKYTTAIQADRYFKVFMYGRVLRILEQISIDRKNIRSSIKSFEIAKDRLKNGRSVLVFPEGTRSRNGKMGNFKSLPFRFAQDTDAPIMPVGLIGFEKIQAETGWIRPAKLKVRFGKPISSETLKSMDAKELKELVKSEIVRLANEK